MVFYFTCSDPRFTIYMGKDKYENESLIAYGWPEDLWFHVDKLSSAHVYLRLPPEVDFDSVPMALVEECAQLTKLNSIEGCKLNDVPIVYTPWANLKKTGDMATGQVGFHNRAAVRHVTIHSRNNEICNRLNKTKVEQHNNPAELYDVREAKFESELKERKKSQKAGNKSEALEAEAARRDKAELEEFKARSAAERAEETRVMQERIVANFAATTVSSDDGGGGYRDALDDLLDDIDEHGLDQRPQEELSSAELAKKSAFAAAMGKGREMDNLTAIAHARKSEAEAKKEQQLLEKAARVAAKKVKAEKEAAERPTMMAAAATAAAERAAAARAALEAEGGCTSEALDENRSMQEDERIVLQAMFGEDDCTLLEADEGGEEPPGVTLVVEAPNKKGEDRSIRLRARMPSEYPSHLPPTCEVLEGIETKVECTFVADSLALLFFDHSVGECVVPMWAEWLRDEWIAKQTS
jgi:hypothetical protein